MVFRTSRERTKRIVVMEGKKIIAKKIWETPFAVS